MIATLNPEIARSGPIYRPAQLALVLSEKMVAENLAASSRIRSARRRVVKSGLTTIDPTAPKQFAQ